MSENKDDFFKDEEVNEFIETINNENIENEVRIIKETNNAEEVTRKMFNFVIAQLNEIMSKEDVINKVRDKILEKIENEEVKLSELQSVYRLLADDRRINTSIFAELFKKGKDGSDTVFTSQRVDDSEESFLNNLDKKDIQKLTQLMNYIKETTD